MPQTATGRPPTEATSAHAEPSPSTVVAVASTATVPPAADVVVIGAGQAGLSAAYHLRRRGLGPATATPTTGGDRPPSGTFVVLDGEAGPGGAWRHRWRTLRMATVNKVHDLPGRELPEVDPCAPSREVVPSYYGDYERDFELPILRPVHVHRVTRADDDARGRLLVATDRGEVSARAVINATGTWTKPFWPIYPGQETFRGRQLHTADYVSADEFAGRHVIVVGGGISAVQLLEEISHVADTTWVTRREPVWRDDEFDPDAGRRAVALVEERVRAGLPPRSVVSVTGLIRTPILAAAAERGVMDRRPMFAEITPTGVRWADGTEQRADAILWATGFRSQLDHLVPLRLRGHGGGIEMSGTQVAAEPRLHLVGYGPSASTIGANRAGREAVSGAMAFLGG
ncbi:NAD(P)/FAD-dependent oxidoreductase [Ruania sp. N2-46]|uniref:NAD(P)/FAD-dependent oxidoreductase n=1 Tax=Occultella gossypii TaxID=2800820 RepID=A0ABS7SH05_9MICO|nr:NAD(P)/FAD-dependent oxidoreductase [Occultella gossypii]